MKFKYYWEDFTPGRVWEHGSRQLSQEEIIAFAREWDPQRFHTDPEAAKQTPYGGIIASAWHTGSVMMRMMCDAYLNDSSCVGSPGLDEWRFLQPVRPGDVLRYRGTVLESKPSSSKPERGTVVWRWELLNQRGEVVVSARGAQFFLRRT
jgi:acyl dehydratase